jgi:hypothetical protein
VHPALVEASRVLGAAWPGLEEAATLTAARREAAREAIDDFLSEQLGAERDPEHEPLIVAFGSMGRAEMARGSDFDYLVILNTLVTDPSLIQLYRLAALEGLRVIGIDQPGASGLFGVAVSGTELVNTIGLDGDSNLHLSRRVLLLEESCPLNADAQYQSLLAAICARYLIEDERDEPHVPRFLLNDVVRYWRTVAVDYQAKRWLEVEGKKWGLRYAKLTTSRKLGFAAMVSALFSPVVMDVVATGDFLREQCAIPALGRLAQLAPHLGEVDQQALRDLLDQANWVVTELSDRDFREEALSAQDIRKAEEGSRLHAFTMEADVLQDRLERLFFSAEPLPDAPDKSFGDLTRRYLAF